MPKHHKTQTPPRQRRSVKRSAGAANDIAKSLDILHTKVSAVGAEVHQITLTLEPLVDHVSFIEREILDRVGRGVTPRRSRRR